MVATLPKCPRCGSQDVRRSHRRWYEFVIALLGLFPFRCHGCGARFYATGRQ